jgi:hypothetical protein
MAVVPKLDLNSNRNALLFDSGAFEFSRLAHPLLRSSRTLVTPFSTLLIYGFSCSSPSTLSMGSQLPSAIPCRFFRGRLLAVLLFLFGAQTNLNADVPARLQNTPTAGCYCRCHEASTRSGCSKLCDSRRRAVQWLSTSCMKPRFQPQHDKSGDGPHLHHPDRAQHAHLVR